MRKHGLSFMVGWGLMLSFALMFAPGNAAALSFPADSTATSPMQCSAGVHKTTSVGLTAVNAPATQLFGRRFITFCNSLENSGTPLIKIRIDGVVPVMGLGNPGDVLGVGACVTYNISSNAVPQAISNAAGTALTSLECQ